jgi:nitrate/nitrite-specific signal transduction histidine kinase
MIDNAALGDSRIYEKVQEKVQEKAEKCQELKREIARMWGVVTQLKKNVFHISEVKRFLYNRNLLSLTMLSFETCK